MPGCIASDFSVPCPMCDGRPERIEVVPPGARLADRQGPGGRFRRRCSVCRGHSAIHRDHGRSPLATGEGSAA